MITVWIKFSRRGKMEISLSHYQVKSTFIAFPFQSERTSFDPFVITQTTLRNYATTMLLKLGFETILIRIRCV